MNKTSADKIKSAAPFLIWFRRHLPESSQTQIQPHLERPYQLALRILDCCDSSSPRTVSEIAQCSGASSDTVRQVLLALKEGGMPFAASPNRGWQAVQESSVSRPALVSLSSYPESQQPDPEFVINQS